MARTPKSKTMELDTRNPGPPKGQKELFGPSWVLGDPSQWLRQNSIVKPLQNCIYKHTAVFENVQRKKGKRRGEFKACKVTANYMSKDFHLNSLPLVIG
jgi:hypothetical protein